MDVRQRQEAFRKRWNLKNNPDEEFKKFRTRICVALEDSGLTFAVNVGSTLTASCLCVFGVGTTTELFSLVGTAKDYAELAVAIQQLFWALADCDPSVRLPTGRLLVLPRALARDLHELIRRAMEYSPLVEFEVALAGEDVTIYPAGAALLDTEVVNQNLAWLQDWPGAMKEFETALTIYTAKDQRKYRNLLDNLRRAVEELLRGVLGNGKSLENQKDDLLRWLNGKGFHTQITNMYHTLLFGPFAQYQNDAVKHGDKWNTGEVEFMIYLTGTFMRLILKAHQA